MLQSYLAICVLSCCFGMVPMPPDYRAGSGEMIAMNVQGLGDGDDLSALDLSDCVHGCRTGSYSNEFLEHGRSRFWICYIHGRQLSAYFD